jgi:hypothetical protein
MTRRMALNVGVSASRMSPRCEDENAQMRDGSTDFFARRLVGLLVAVAYTCHHNTKSGKGV